MQELTLLRDQSKQLVGSNVIRKPRSSGLHPNCSRLVKVTEEIHLPTYRNTLCRMRSTAGNGPISTPARPIEVQ